MSKPKETKQRKRRLPVFLFIFTVVVLLVLRSAPELLLLPLPGFHGTGEDLPLPVRDVMQIVLSIIVLLAALFVILSKRYPEATAKWAYGSLGTILGYWLSP